MKTQVIQDHNGVPTGVFIPIKVWEKMKKKYPGIDDTKEPFKLSDEQKKILDSQDNLPLSEYQDNDEFIAELKKEYGL
ncbi:MAG: hypothetical protein LBQ84_06885 [Flavobacteriaceae bacterium]|jgi:hypothetical protein|nr:hypothetical protein [Flavobacteriaceae bacterium]